MFFLHVLGPAFALTFVLVLFLLVFLLIFSSCHIFILSQFRFSFCWSFKCFVYTSSPLTLFSFFILALFIFWFLLKIEKPTWILCCIPTLCPNILPLLGYATFYTSNGFISWFWILHFNSFFFFTCIAIRNNKNNGDDIYKCSHKAMTCWIEWEFN